MLFLLHTVAFCLKLFAITWSTHSQIRSVNTWWSSDKSTRSFFFSFQSAPAFFWRCIHKISQFFRLSTVIFYFFWDFFSRFARIAKLSHRMRNNWKNRTPFHLNLISNFWSTCSFHLLHFSIYMGFLRYQVHFQKKSNFFQNKNGYYCHKGGCHCPNRHTQAGDERFQLSIKFFQKFKTAFQTLFLKHYLKHYTKQFLKPILKPYVKHYLKPYLKQYLKNYKTKLLFKI